MKLRLPAELKTNVEAAARDAGRSLNAEIVYRLERSFVRDELLLEPLISALLTSLDNMASSSTPEVAGMRLRRVRRLGQTLKTTLKDEPERSEE